jgi:hypothetical protein
MALKKEERKSIKTPYASLGLVEKFADEKPTSKRLKMWI